MAAYENPVVAEKVQISFEVTNGEEETEEIYCNQGYLPFKTNASHKVVTAQWLNGGIGAIDIGSGYQSGNGVFE